jgi:RND family efflux transporter MFP subunit
MKQIQVSKKTLLAAASIAGLVVLLLYMQGSLGGGKVAPGTVAAPKEEAAGSVARVEKREVVETREWPGTVLSRTLAEVAPKVMARVLEVNVRAGDTVRRGDVIARLDARDAASRVAQARSSLVAAQAQARQAEADDRRIRKLVEERVATRQALDAADARAKASRAEATRARDALEEAQVLLSETTVRAPFDAIVDERLAEPGDMGEPGKPLARIHSRAHLQLEARVPEQYVRGLSVGSPARVRFDAPARDIPVTIEEIAPAADPESRTFLVKAGLPPDSDLHPGLFGRLLQPSERREALLVPAAAITWSGQLEMTRVIEGGEVRTRNVQTGKAYGDRVEVLSGLHEGERVIIGIGQREER